jgi:O-6-methylguanine DNA methyltransferase
MKTARTISSAAATIMESRREARSQRCLFGLRRQSGAATALLEFGRHANIREPSPKAVSRFACHRSPKPGGNPNGTLIEMSIATPLGNFTARYSENGLAELKFPSAGRVFSLCCRRRGNESQISSTASTSARDSSRPPSAVLLRRTGRLLPTKILRWHRTTAAALKAVLAGREPENFPPLDLAGTAFQKRVWNALWEISPGETKSYGEIARAIGKSLAARAVGGACGANPIPVLVPCHRVLAANKKLGGFSGGLRWKRKLLAREGVKF